ncbi:MAG: hypothetical protein WD360_03565 [Nitriliruptoraceae bacterium]
MTNVNSPLPPRRRSQAGEPPADPSVTAPKMTVPNRAVSADEIGAGTVSSGLSPLGSVTKPGSSGSAKARALRETLRSPNGFFTAVQTAELLALPVGLRPPSR